MRVWSLSREDTLEENMATHSSILAWRIPWTEEPGGLQSMGSQRVRHDLATEQTNKSIFTAMKVLCSLPICPFPCPTPDLFIVSTVLSFPECYIVEIKYYVKLFRSTKPF